MRIKVCGLTREEDIKLLLEMSVDYLGFNFIESSPRCVEMEWAEVMCKKYSLNEKFVALLHNPTKETVKHIHSFNKLSSFQIYGTYEAFISNGIHFVPISATGMKQYDLSQLKPIKNTVYLLDNMSTGLGGTGKKFDWSLLDNLDLSHFMIAGGVGLADLTRLNQLNVWGADLNSSLEVTPGIKDSKKLSMLKDFRNE